MTDATKTADILAAWQLIEDHGLSVARVYGEFRCHNQAFIGKGPTLATAVRTWAESAGVPW